ncbi:lysozyme g-like [Clavelina lepadiformis]|uniref:lysozyme g-like n=1 Tax=Clavelina lepadiformis TaxID=159417 RepID=UPI0040413F1A
MRHTHAHVAVVLGFILVSSSIWTTAEGWFFSGSSRSSSSSRPSTRVSGNSRRQSFPSHSSRNTFNSRLSALGSRNPLSTSSRSSSFSLRNPLSTSDSMAPSLNLRNPSSTSNSFSSFTLKHPLPGSGRTSLINSRDLFSRSSRRHHSSISVPRVKPKTSGDIGNLNPTGASAATARSDGLSYTGVRASRQMARNDLSRINNYKSNIINAARNYNMDPAVVAGIISRESRGGVALSSTGTGDHGNGFGLMQVDKRHHSTKGGPYSVDHLNQGTKIISDNLKAVKAMHPNWSPDQQLQGAIAAYNFGVDDVRSWKGLDRGSTHDDYSNDVVARAKFFRENGFRKE